MHGYLFFHHNYLRLIIDQDPWAIITTVATFVLAYAAIKPIWDKAKLGKALFEDAIQVDISIDGVFTIYNIFDEPVSIKKIEQQLIRGSQIGLQNVNNSNSIADVLKKFSFPEVYVSNRINKSLPPKVPFVYAGSLTHFPGPMEAESVWVVRTKISYSSPNGHQSRTVKFAHRYSRFLEPRVRWVELF